MSKPTFTDPWFSKKGVVYFIAAGYDEGAHKSIKIGVTISGNLLRRLRAIQSANHEPIYLLRVIEIEGGMREAELKELELHKQFAKLARVVHGSVGYEWFKAADELLLHIKGIGVPASEMRPDIPNRQKIIELFDYDKVGPAAT